MDLVCVFPKGSDPTGSSRGWAAHALCNCNKLHGSMKQEERFYFCWLLLSIAFRITEVIFLKLSRKKYCVEAETELKQVGWSRSFQQFPMCKHLPGLLALPVLCSSQVLSRSWACSTRRGLGHLHIRTLGKRWGISPAPSPASPWYLGAEGEHFSFHASVQGTAGRHRKL